MTDTTWDEECQVLVVGSGGGAMTGAFVAANNGLDTLVIEKADVVGGTTAYSGSGLWLPGNEPERRGGVDDSIDKGREYLKATVGDRTPAELQEKFLQTGPAMIAYLESQGIPFFWRTFPDYFANRPGAIPEGRNIFPEDLEGAALGDKLDLLRPTVPVDRLGIEFDRTVLTGGQALIGRMWLKLEATGKGRISLNTTMTGLIQDDSGAVIGVEATRDGTPVRIRASRGVLLAAGGFERNEEKRQQYQGETAAWTMGAPTNMGEPIWAGMEIGAATDLLDENWYTPGVLFADGSGTFTLGLSGGIMVNSAGQRFANESWSYDRFGHALRAAHAAGPPAIPAWWIFDSRFGLEPPGMVIPPILDPKELLDAGLWKQADTIEELAEQIGVPVDNLTATVQRFNGFVETGVDEEFHRGEEAFDLFWGIGTDGPNPCLVPIVDPPFTAVTIILGDLGTKGGLKTDTDARVVREDGSVIPGLYAAGNTMASVMGQVYPGPGSPVGSCLVFSYLAALDMAAASDR